VALVTGARRGIGRAAAERLAREGIRVCLADAAIAHFSSEEASFVSGEIPNFAGGPGA
jgi:3-oxoacyl-[acyl-carrier protein] reductase